MPDTTAPEPTRDQLYIGAPLWRSIVLPSIGGICIGIGLRNGPGLAILSGALMFCVSAALQTWKEISDGNDAA